MAVVVQKGQYTRSTTVPSIYRHFKRHDPVLFSVLRDMKLEILTAQEKPSGYFKKLCREIISQQLAGRAAAAIHTRFLNLFPGKKITPAGILKYSEEELRATGMSWAKARYVRNLANHMVSGTLNLRHLEAIEDEAVIAELTKVKGIGRWTAEMFLIFTLGREDVFSHGDLGLQKGLHRLYGATRTNTTKKVRAIISPWSPYKSYASLALWHALDGKKI